MGQNFALPYDIDEDELMGELDGMEDELAGEFESGAGAPSYLQVPAICGCLLELTQSHPCLRCSSAPEPWPGQHG